MDDMKKIVTRTKLIELADDQNPLLALKYHDIGKNASSPQSYATLTIDANGSDDAKLIVFLNIGASSTDYSQYQFSASASGVVDPGGVDSSPTHTQCTTLGALIAAINALGVEANRHTSTDPIGIYAARVDGPADYSIDTDDFIDLAATNMTPTFLNCLYRDASEITHMSGRVGNPGGGDINGKQGGGKLRLIKVQGKINSASGTDCEFKISQDPNEISADDEKELGFTRNVPDDTWTDLWDYADNPITLNGPLLIEAVATSSMAAGGKLLFHYGIGEV
jgi:hypothetical protein